MAKNNNYYVIGGQYAYKCYGGTPTLLGAKRLARKCTELWDNHKGYHVPSIYAAEDTKEADTFYGRFQRVPADDYAVPVAVYFKNRWMSFWDAYNA